MTSKILEGFSVTHAAILDGRTLAEDALTSAAFGDIYGVRTASVAADTGNYDNTGDDGVLSTWYWINYATLTVQAGYLPFDTIAMLSGVTITSSGTGTGDYYSLPLWTRSSLNQPPKPVLVRIPARDKDGLTRTLDYVLFKVNFSPISFDGPQYKSGVLVNYGGRAVLSDVDEAGNALAEPAIGRIISRPAI